MVSRHLKHIIKFRLVVQLSSTMVVPSLLLWFVVESTTGEVAVGVCDVVSTLLSGAESPVFPRRIDREPDPLIIDSKAAE